MSSLHGSTVLIVQDINSLEVINKNNRKVRETHTSTDSQPRNADGAVDHGSILENARQQQLEGNWKQFSGRVKEAWGVLTDADVDRAEGRLDQLVGTIEEKTGEARAAVARKLKELASSIQG